MTDLANATPANTNEMPTAPVTESVAPVVEPVTEPVVPAVEPVVEGKEPTATQLPEVPEVELEPTGNQFVDDLLGEFKSNDVDVDKLFGDYLETGDEASIDFAYLEEKVGKLAAQGLIAGVRAENDKAEAESSEAAVTIYEAAGGEALWEGVLEWIGSGKSGLSKAGGESYNTMLAAGGVQAELAARELSKMFQASPGFTQPAQLQTADQTQQVSGIEQISRADYVSQLDVVVRKSGEYSPEAEALHRRRTFTMEQGR